RHLARAAGERHARRAQGQGRIRDSPLEAADRGGRRLRRLSGRRMALAGAAPAAPVFSGETRTRPMTFNRSDLGAGAIFIAIGLGFAAITLLELDIGTARRMGPGYFPIMLSGIL